MDNSDSPPTTDNSAHLSLRLLLLVGASLCQQLFQHLSVERQLLLLLLHLRRSLHRQRRVEQRFRVLLSSSLLLACLLGLQSLQLRLSALSRTRKRVQLK